MTMPDTTEHPLRITPSAPVGAEYLLRRLRDAEAARDRALVDLERANRALFSCAQQVTELRARLGGTPPALD